MKRIFVFSYHGKETYQTGFNRLLSLSEKLAESYEVHFVYGNKNKVERPIKIRGNLIEIPLSYTSGFFHNNYKKLIESGKRITAKFLLATYFFFTGKEIFDLGREFDNYKKKTNINLDKEDVILVSFPSIAIHNLGYALKQEFGCKLVLDYRDPGVFGYQQIEDNKILSFLRKRFLKRRELRNLKSADLIITISESIRTLFPEKYRTDISLVRNGYDFKKINFHLIKHHPYTFKLVYLGTVYNDQLQDTTFFKALRKFIDTHKVQPQYFQIRFIGTGESLRLKELIKHYNLEPYTYISQKMPIEQIYTELYSAAMFFHLKYGDRKEIITTKQYEYLAFQKPILLPVNDHGDLEESIKKYNAGFICENEEEIIEVLKNSMDNHFKGKPARINRTEEELYELSRQGQEEKLLKLIEKL
ncbi:glycosyltransferase family protein [Pedobacter sp.]